MEASWIDINQKFTKQQINRLNIIIDNFIMAFLWYYTIYVYSLWVWTRVDAA